MYVYESYICGALDLAHPLRDFVSDYLRVVSVRHSFGIGLLGRTTSCSPVVTGLIKNQIDPKIKDLEGDGRDKGFAIGTAAGNPLLYDTSIRVLCNANTSEGLTLKRTFPSLKLRQQSLLQTHLTAAAPHSATLPGLLRPRPPRPDKTHPPGPLEKPRQRPSSSR
ncbi:hypothetical protein ACFX1S_043937 [Malus domestica]